MAAYLVKLLSPEGEVTAQRVEVANEEELFAVFGRRNYVILEYRRDYFGGIRGFLSRFTLRRSISKKELADFCYYLGRALDMGIPVLGVLEDLEKAAKNAFYRKVVGEIRQQVSLGSSMFEAMKSLKVFPGDLVGLVKLGEETDALPRIFQNYAEYLDWKIRIEKEVKKSLSYPAFVLVVLVITMVIMFWYILPAVLPVIESLGLKEYPLPTKILMALGYFFKQFGLQFIALIIATFVLIILTVKKSKKIRYVWHRLKLKLPLIGEIFLKASLASDMRAIAEVFRSGGTILFSVRLIVKFVEGNLYIKGIFDRIKEYLIQGNMLSAAMERTGFFDASVVRMVKLGEETGAMDKSLMRLAEIYQDDMRRKIEALTVMVEPVLQLTLGVFLGILALGLLMPIYNVMTKIK